MVAMICPKCGKPIPPGTPECPDCRGASVDAFSAPASLIRSTGAETGDDEDIPEALIDEDDGEAASHELPPGVLIADRFEVIRPIGKGGMGFVYECQDRHLTRRVAVKQLLPELSANEQSVQRFMVEARVVAGLNHPNIVQVYDVIDQPDQKFIVMELVEGESLLHRLHRAGRFDAAETVRILSVIGQALDVAHEKNIIHRDVKPGNILLTREGIPKLSDFGISQAAGIDDLTRTGTAMGSWVYAAPEQLEDAKHVDQRADVYSLGATLYEMLSGELPRHVDIDKVPVSFRPILKNSMARFRDARYASAGDFVRAIENALNLPSHPEIGEGASSMPGETVHSEAETVVTPPPSARREREIFSVRQSPLACNSWTLQRLLLAFWILPAGFLLDRFVPFILGQMASGGALPIERLHGLLDFFQYEPAFRLSILAALLLLVWILLRRFTTRYTLTTTKLRIRSGFLFPAEVELHLHEFDGVYMTQDTLGKLLNYGNLELGRKYQDPVVLEAVPNPLLLRKRFQDALRG